MAASPPRASAFASCLLAAAAAIAAVTTAGCSGVTPRPAARPDAQEVDDLKARVVELQRKAAMSEVEIARLSQRIAELEAGSGRPRSTPPRPAPSTGSTPSVGTGGTREMPEPVGSPRPTSPSLGREVKPVVEESDLDLPPASPPSRPVTPPSRPAAPAPTKPAPASVRSPAAAPAPAPTAPASPANGEPVAAQALYDRGYTLYNQGRFADAEASFQRFLQADPEGELADNAQYWIGECRYGRNDLRGALAAFRETVERYPAGNKVPDALLKAAQTLEGLGDMDKARTAYDEVIRKFPESTAAAAAAERKARLR